MPLLLWAKQWLIENTTPTRGPLVCYCIDLFLGRCTGLRSSRSLSTFLLPASRQFRMPTTTVFWRYVECVLALSTTTLFLYLFCFSCVTHRRSDLPDGYFANGSRESEAVIVCCQRYQRRFSLLVLVSNYICYALIVSLRFFQSLKSKSPKCYYSARGEDLLRKSGLTYTIIRVGGFNNAPGGLQAIEVKQVNIVFHRQKSLQNHRC